MPIRSKPDEAAFRREFELMPRYRGIRFWEEAFEYAATRRTFPANIGRIIQAKVCSPESHEYDDL